jgi:hypothetical protein
VWTGSGGRRWLKNQSRTYDLINFGWEMEISLDSRAGPRSDAIMHIVDDEAMDDCWIHPRGHPGQQREGKFRIPDTVNASDRASCVVPLATVRPRKGIRWRLLSVSWWKISENVERAPDHAFYRQSHSRTHATSQAPSR